MLVWVDAIVENVRVIIDCSISTMLIVLIEMKNKNDKTLATQRDFFYFHDYFQRVHAKKNGDFVPLFY